MKRIILQAVTEHNHISALNSLISGKNSETIILSSAFISEAGLSLIEDEIKKVAANVKIFAGIRNGITTAQALEKAISLGCDVYAVDTGSRHRIFHPKLYFRKSDSTSEIIIGSANLTVGGLNSNIEASLCQEIDTSTKADIEFIDRLIGLFNNMIAEHPEHVIKIENTDLINELLRSGRIIDEADVQPPSASSSSGDRELDQTPLMKLKSKFIKRAKHVSKKSEAKPSVPKTTSGKPVRPTDSGLELLWESGELRRRDLDIPISEGTHATGSMLWKKGASDIDQQTYFRKHVFDKLDWKPDSKIESKEFAEGDFQIIIRGVDYGVHRLTVTHDNRTETTSYKQRQPMTAVRWGEARPLIAKEDLLERVMRLYRDLDEAGLFVIDID